LGLKLTKKLQVSTMLTIRNPVNKITEKAVCRSVLLTIWYCILNTIKKKNKKKKKRTPSDCFLAIVPTGEE